MTSAQIPLCGNCQKITHCEDADPEDVVCLDYKRREENVYPRLQKATFEDFEKNSSEEDIKIMWLQAEIEALRDENYGLQEKVNFARGSLENINHEIERADFYEAGLDMGIVKKSVKDGLSIINM